MRKFLSLVFAAFVACTVSAQPKSAKYVAKTPYAKAGMVKKTMDPANTPQNMGKAFSLTAARNSIAAGRMLTANELKDLKPVNKMANVAGPRKAGQLLSTYIGNGVNYKTKENETWEMLSGQTEDGTPLLVDVIPLPANMAALKYIAVEYTQDGNKIRIEPQIVAKTSSYYVYILDGTSDDCAIEFTLEDDGSLTTEDGQDILYGAFTTDEFPYENFEDNYLGYVFYISNIKYTLPGQIVLPTAGYEPEGLLLNVCPNVNGNYSTSALLPAYGQLTMKNRTSGTADAYAWTLQEIEYNAETKTFDPIGEALTSTEKDFQFMTIPGIYNSAQLVASIGGNDAEPFTWSRDSWFVAGSADEWDDGETPTYLFSKADADGSGLTALNPAGCTGMIFYQGKPASALYFEGVAMQIYEYASKVSDGGLPVITCKICKAHRSDDGNDFTLGEVIAKADLTEVETGSWYPRLVWRNFYVEDEFGMTEGIDYLLIDEEFAVVVEGWDNETFTGRPLGLLSRNATGVTSTYAILTGETDYTGSGWFNFTGNIMVGFLDATYGYLHTEDNTELTIANEGGEATLHVEPYYVSLDEEGNRVTGIWLENEEEAEWVSFETTNEAYGDGDEVWSFDLVIKAEPLPADMSGRTATLKFAQTGALLNVTVIQGDGTNGISGTTVSVSRNDGATYNVVGQRVDASYKGIVICNGKKLIVK